jgi:hypothetical protein
VGARWCRIEGRFTLRWRSAPVGQECQPKIWLFEVIEEWHVGEDEKTITKKKGLKKF